MLDKSCVPLLKVSSQDCGMHLIVIKRNWIQLLLNLRQFSFLWLEVWVSKHVRSRVCYTLQRFLYSFQRPSANSTVKPPNAIVSISGSHFKFQSRHSQHSSWICSKLLSETFLVFVIYVILICTVRISFNPGTWWWYRREFNFSSSYLAVLSWCSRHEAACS